MYYSVIKNGKFTGQSYVELTKSLFEYHTSQGETVAMTVDIPPAYEPSMDEIFDSEGEVIVPALPEVLAREATAEEIAEGVARSRKYGILKSVEDIIVTVDSMGFDGDEISQGRMARAVSAGTDETETTGWVLADNTPAIVTRAQLRQALNLAGEAQTLLWMS